VIISRTCGPLQPGERHSQAFSPHKRELDPRSGVTVWRLHDLRRTVVSGIQKKQGRFCQAVRRTKDRRFARTIRRGVEDQTIRCAVDLCGML
jgi:hypothetical protein